MKKTEKQISTCVDKETYEAWIILCKHWKKSSYQILREHITRAVNDNKAWIDSVKQQQKKEG